MLHRAPGRPIKPAENAAICLCQADKFSEARLAPRIGEPQRGRYLSLMVYSTSQIEPSMGDHLMKRKLRTAKAP